MTPFGLQIIIFFASMVALSYYGFGIRYFTIFCIPFYATPLFLVSLASTQIMPVHAASVFLMLWVLISQKPLSKKSTIQAILLLTPFLISLLYNYFFFEPVLTWETDGSKRIDDAKFVTKTSLNSTNLTQLIFIVYGLVMYVLFSSIQLKLEKLQKTIDGLLYVVSGVGLFQLFAYYFGFHDVYKFMFNNLDTQMANQVIVWGIKRINSTFQEPSYFGHFLFYSLIYYVAQFGYQKFLDSRAVWVTVAIGLLSTATTFYVGFLVLILLLYFKYANDQERMRYYIILLIIVPLVLYLGYDYAETYLNAKTASTNERWLVSWTLAWEGVFNSPLFGYGYGTSRPLFIYTQLLFSIGIVGTILFLFFLFRGQNNSQSNTFLFCVAIVGILAIEITRHEIWIFLGLLVNRSLREQMFELRQKVRPVSREVAYGS